LYFSFSYFTNQTLKFWFSLYQINKLISLLGSVDSFISISITAKLGNLEIINLKDVNIKKLAEKTFEGLTSLTKINLHHNKLTDLDKQPFEGLTSLTSLTLSDNKLTKRD